MFRRSKFSRQTYLPLLELPEELLEKTSSFLAAQDLVSLSRSCQSLHSLFHMSLLPPTDVFPRLGWIGHPINGEERKESVRIPIMLGRHVHSVRLEFSWRDQGWGHQKGEVWVVAKKTSSDDTTDESTNDETAKEFGGGRVVFASEISPHATTKVIAWFTIRPDEVYSLWYKVGSGGGHSLHLEDGKIQLFVRDDKEWNLRTNYSALLKAGIIPIKKDQPSFHPRFLMTVIESLIRQYEGGQGDGAIDPHVLAMLRQYGLATTVSGFHAILEILADAQALAAQQEREPSPPSLVRPPDPPPNLHANRNVRLGRIIRLQRQPALHAGGGIPPGGPA